MWIPADRSVQDVYKRQAVHLPVKGLAGAGDGHFRRGSAGVVLLLDPVYVGAGEPAGGGICADADGLLEELVRRRTVEVPYIFWRLCGGYNRNRGILVPCLLYTSARLWKSREQFPLELGRVQNV